MLCLGVLTNLADLLYDLFLHFRHFITSLISLRRQWTRAGSVYLDHAGATLCAQRQLSAHMLDLQANLFGNPHSRSPSSELATERIDAVRARILRCALALSQPVSSAVRLGCSSHAAGMTVDVTRAPPYLETDSRPAKFQIYDSLSRRNGVNS